jgi:hypothetical protein
MHPLTRRAFLNGLTVTTALGLASGLGACAVYTDRGPLYATYPDYYYDYYYYPSIGIYYHLFSGDYFYPHRGRWWRTRDLPHHFRLDKHHRIPLHIKKDRPYDDYRDHHAKFAKSKDWERDRRKGPRALDLEDRRERRHNLDQHIKYHRKH